MKNTLLYGVNKPTTDELRFCEYLGKIDGEDVHLLKKVVTKDGVSKGLIELIFDFKFPVWTTKKIYRDHVDKKEYEHFDKLDEHWTTQSQKAQTVAKHIQVGKVPEMCKMRDVISNPYVYGLNIEGSSYIKDHYIRNTVKNTGWRVGVLDTEVDIENSPDEHMTHISIACPEYSYLGVMRSRFPSDLFPNDEFIIADIKREYIENVPGGITAWDTKERTIELFDDIPTMIETTFAVLHTWNIDILGIWNADYDITKLEIEYEQRAGRAMSNLFHDPRLHRKFAYYNYYRGQTSRTTILDDGSENTQNFEPHAVWNDLVTSAGFKTVDAQGLFYQIRSQGPDQEGGLSLDNVTSRFIKTKKIHDDSPYRKGAWHIHTSKHRPAFYSCYSMFDCDIMLRLDNKTLDLRDTGHSQLDSCPWRKFSSLPYRLHVAFHFYISTLGYAVGTKGKSQDPDPILGTGKGWIITVEAFKVIGETYTKFKGMIDHFTTHYGHTYDMDKVSAYPRVTCCENVGKQSTRTEVIKIGKVERNEFLKHNINLLINKCNIMTYNTNMMGYPGFKQLHDLDVTEYKNRELVLES